MNDIVRRLSTNRTHRLESFCKTRDLRLDVFRGLALLCIFVDHIPSNAAASFTLRNLGFSDAAEIFVFLSGYSTALAYGPGIARRGLLHGAVATLRRAWQIYLAHVLVLLVCIGLVLFAADFFGNPDYLEQMSLGGFRAAPLDSLLQSLLLRFRAANMDVLPLYVLLLALSAPMLALLSRWPRGVLGASALLWMAATRFNWNLDTYPDGGAWLFNPFCWQFLFVIGSACAIYSRRVARLFAMRRWLLPCAVGYLVAAFALVLTWRVPGLETWIPDAMARAIYPISKSNLDVLRLGHFLAFAYVAGALIPRNSSGLRSVYCRPLVLCGQQSLPVFCLGIVLALVAHVTLLQVGGGIGLQFVVSFCGCALLIHAAALLEKNKRQPRRSWTSARMERSEAP